MGIRVAVTGGRKYWNRSSVFRALDSVHADQVIDTVIHGAAKGADTLAGNWAEENYIPEWRFYARWKVNGKLFLGAGPERNERALRQGKPDLVMAFPGGKGTANMLKQAKKMGIKIRSYT